MLSQFLHVGEPLGPLQVSAARRARQSIGASLFPVRCFCIIERGGVVACSVVQQQVREPAVVESSGQAHQLIRLGGMDRASEFLILLADESSVQGIIDIGGGGPVKRRRRFGSV